MDRPYVGISNFLILCLLAFTLIIPDIVRADGATYPKALTTKEIQAHFLQFTNFETDQGGRSFSFSIDGKEAQRVCPDCNYTHDVGLVTYKPMNNLICIEWEIVNFPDSGCFTLVQTGELQYEMRKLREMAVFRYQVATKSQPADEVLAPGWIPSYEFGRSILADLSKINPEIEKLQSAINAALISRGWQLEKFSNKKTIFARINKSLKIYRIKIEYREPWLAIGFIKGYQHKRDNWLRNIKKDILNNLTTR